MQRERHSDRETETERHRDRETNRDKKRAELYGVIPRDDGCDDAAAAAAVVAPKGTTLAVTRPQGGSPFFRKGVGSPLPLVR